MKKHSVPLFREIICKEYRKVLQEKKGREKDRVQRILTLVADELFNKTQERRRRLK